MSKDITLRRDIVLKLSGEYDKINQQYREKHQLRVAEAVLAFMHTIIMAYERLEEK